MHPDILGWAAAALMVATFSCREARHLRPLAVATNVAFVGYGAAAGLMPVLALHLLLLPINLWRWAQAVALSRKGAQQMAEQLGRLLCVLVLSAMPLLAACGGGGGDDGPGSPPPASPPAAGTPPAAPAGTIGAAGGTVSTDDGVELVVPAGALASEVAIEVQVSAAGAPAFPPGVAAWGKTFALTPHGTSFSTPVTVTVPFDPALASAGEPPVLYKADSSGPAAGMWHVVEGATVVGNTLRASIDSLSHLVVGPPALELAGLQRRWSYEKLLASGGSEVVGPRRAGWTEVYDRYDYLGQGSGEISGNATGGSYDAGAVSPFRPGPGRTGPEGTWTHFAQVQTFLKRLPDASLDFTITSAHAEARDFDPRPLVCQRELVCLDLHAEAEIEVTGSIVESGKVFFHRKGRFYVAGGHGQWRHGVFSSSEVPLWNESDFTVDTDVNRNGRHDQVNMLLRVQGNGRRIDVPLQDVLVGQRVTLRSVVHVMGRDRRQTETKAWAYLRDPQNMGGGVTVQHRGLLPVGGPSADPPAPLPQPAPVCTSAEPQAGTLQFESATIAAEEHALPSAWVVVTRAGGTQGRVGATVVTRGGTATPGEDYTAISTYVGFADGEGGRRIVAVPLNADLAPEADETIGLELTDPRGCATLGSPSEATLTILDDDSVVPPATYRVGGTVAGLAGPGLVLEDRAHFIELPIATDGLFEFNRAYSAGAAYDVRVKTQPTQTPQLCTVTRGTGVVGSSNVADIAVDCATPPPPSGLDLSFGAGTGRVTAGPAGVAKAIALLPDGRIVAAIGNSVARYLADGTLDTTFGSNGSVSNVVGPTNFGAEILDLAVQADGRIVAAGTARGSSFSTLAYDFAAARLNADGSRDASFNGGNALQVDWIGAPDRATRVLLQPDGKIVLAGTATTVYTPSTDDSAIALVRLNADGSLDTGFGSGGRAVAELAQLDFGQAAVLQPDGRIVVAGRVSDNRGDDAHLAVARFNADGTLDTTFGSGGTVRHGELADATALALQPDGRLVLALAHTEAGNTGFGVVRLNADGSVDTAFGAAGLARLDIGPGIDVPLGLALQADGRIVAVGSALNTATSYDFVVARLLPSGAADTAFGSGGFYSLDFFRGRDGAYDVLVQPDGKVLVGGLAGNGLSTQPLLMRFHP